MTGVLPEHFQVHSVLSSVQEVAMQLLMASLPFAVTCIGYYIYCFVSSYTAARKTRLPILLTPVHPLNPFWLILGPCIIRILQPIVPGWLQFRLDVAIRGYEFRLRNKLHENVGSTFLLVGPGYMQVLSRDTEVIKKVTGHGGFKDFAQSKLLDQIAGIFGPQIIGANGEDWQRQRKIIAPILNERISLTVWNESVRQAEEMVNHFMKESFGNTQSATDKSIKGLRRIAINVLGASAYGTPRPWTAKEEQAPAGFALGYMNSLLAMADHQATAIFFSPRVLSLPFVPAFAKKVGTAKKEFPRYVANMITKERASADVENNNILSAMVKASDRGKAAGKPETKETHLYLSESEIYGNLYLFTLAGYDTTANTMAFALTLLAIYPEWQEWIVEEIDRVYKDGDLSYEQAFSRLKRCLALMFETLRLYSPVEHLTRTTTSPQTIATSSGDNYDIPPGIDVVISQAGAHVEPNHWAPDPLTWRPRRWIADASNQVNNEKPREGEQEHLVEPERGAFIPWSFGPRNCPGQKMSQVEFVAVIATIFRACKIEPVLLANETTTDDARRRLETIVADSTPTVSLSMTRPEDVVLRWVKRS